MKTKFSGILTLLLAFVVQLSFAQEKTISGTVSDETGLPLPGTTVLVKGTSSGVSSDFDGNYAIKASQGATLIFSFVGYTSQEIVVGSSNTINVTMTEDAAKLEEVLIVGYGTSTKQSFAGTATTVTSENLEIKNVSNLSQALAGEVAGVTVINTSGQPGTTSTIRIRGFGSVNGNRNPLYVVDGVPLISSDRDSDGNTYSSGVLNSINPSDIESTTVLKDATATAIYGSRGANGVILITTKNGSRKDTYIEAEVKSGINTQIIPRYNVIKSPEEYIGYAWEGLYNRAVISGQADPVSYTNANFFGAGYLDPGYNMWNVDTPGQLIDPATHKVREGVTRRYTPMLYSDAAFDSGYRNEGSLRMGGGNDKSKYYFSLGYLNDDGYAINTGYDRYTSRLNLDSDIKDWLNVGANISYAYAESKNNGQTVGSENLFEFADKMAPIFPVYLRDDNYQLVNDPIFGGYVYDFGNISGYRARNNADGLNPIGTASYDKVGFKRHEVSGNFSMNIKFTEDLTFETRYGMQYSIERYHNYGNPFYGGSSTGENPGSLFARDRERISSNFLQLLRYKKQFGDHSFEVLGAHESQEYTLKQTSQSKALVVVDGLLELDNFLFNLSPPSGFSEGTTLESYFSQINYDYKDKYYLTASIRTDGSSRFINDKWGTFGSVGAAWVASNEDFLKSDFLTFLKLKTSYGITGDQDGISYYDGYDTYNTSNVGGIAISPADNGNPDLTWETSKMFQAGLEFSLGTFLDGNIDYYQKRTVDQFFDRRVGPSAGIAIIKVNDGELTNQGLEFDLTTHLVDTKNFKLNLGFNGEILANKLTAMPIDPATGAPKYLDNSATYYGYSEGRSIFDFYMREWAGVDPADGSPMWYQYYDDKNDNGILDSGEGDFSVVDGDEPNQTGSIVEYEKRVADANIKKTTTHTYADATQVYVNKSAIPDLRGAFRLGASLKNWTFSTQFTYSIGGWAYDAQYGELMSDRFGTLGNNYHSDIADRWMQPGDITNVPRLSDGYDQNSTATSTRFLTKTDYIALNNAMIGYNFPQKFLADSGISSVNIWASGDNLFVKSAREGFNPTTSETGNTGRRLYAPLTTFTMGVRVKF
ncbi:SusC/RagA family TonB-linked outer membrane protein [Aestuariibaculum lutulentum]|uniref:SusC/RagA family TonB-linked outer membrane protein n=1 Tax=Aestuariibaculum lutulentum TaxID=2920935 RepID=A0ABS9RGA0_9FLAO|nr:SusC/RagA family TonB-linked outer membrane protein [Aestuariibaculum lutulentum]MCH4551531.1 SusC/RagA family TonB-linked outer membrane protein [Aestuariibaculum lutulentum]